jgi:hypothetical protein
MAQRSKDKLSFERTEEISLPINDSPARIVYARDWQLLKRQVSRLNSQRNTWQRRFDLSLAAAVAFGIAWLTPNDYTFYGFSAQLVFGYLTIASGVFAIAALLAKKSEKDATSAGRSDLETWIADVEDLHKSPDYHASERVTAITTASNEESKEDPLYESALELARQEGSISTSRLQRRLRIGYGRAARIVDKMEENGIVGEIDGAKPRRLLIDKAESDEV